jgi:signal transduction histidine kinase
MKGVVRIITRYVLSAAGIAIILLITNIIVLVLWLTTAVKYSNNDYKISNISEGLKEEDNGFVLAEEAAHKIDDAFQWAMLLSDEGKVIWSKNLPQDMPLSYTVSEVAAFSRWYLKDYPVYTWRHENGLFIIASSKNSLWKMQLEVPEKLMRNTPEWLMFALIINLTVAILLTFLFGIRFFLSLRKVIEGIEDMAKKKPVSLSTKGVFKELALNINKTSKEILRQQQIIEKRDLARNNWITGVSHDIRTPLCMIMGYSSALEDNERFSEEERKQFSIIRLQSEKIRELVKDLNLTIKLQYEMQPLNLQAFYISELIRKVIVDHLNNLQDDKYTLQLSVSDEAQGFMINGDMRLFERALTNIIGNSIKHNEDGCDINIKIEKNNQECLIEIKDNGVGFPEEVLESLNFSTEMPVGVSHGLGLFIVKQIIAVHGGTIEFKNLEKGSSVHICMPMNS